MRLGGRSDLRALLARFPKARPDLPPRMAEMYVQQHRQNRTGATPAASIGQRLERWMHLKVAEDVQGAGEASTLEIGAGTLNQLPFEPHTRPYDVVEPFVALYEDSQHRPRIQRVFADIAEAPLERRYDRITSVAALEHIIDLPLVLARAARLLTGDGALRVAIPSEGGFLWAMGWTLTTGLEFRLRHGLDYGALMRHEHVNDAWEIEGLIHALFQDVQVQSFGLGRHLSLYRFIVAARPRLDVAESWEAMFRPSPAKAAAAAGTPALSA